jgi:hypothetical protein
MEKFGVKYALQWTLRHYDLVIGECRLWSWPWPFSSWWNFSELLSLRVFHLTRLLLLNTNTWLSVYCFHCIHAIVTLKPKVRGIGGKRLFEGNGRDTRWIVSDFVRAMNEANRVKLAWVSGCGTVVTDALIGRLQIGTWYSTISCVIVQGFMRGDGGSER